MAMRRPRIKPLANILLNSKRKSKPINDVKVINDGERDIIEAGKKNDILPVKENELLLDSRSKNTTDTTAEVNNLINSINGHENKDEGGRGLQKLELAIEDNTIRTKRNHVNLTEVHDLTKNTNDILSNNVTEETREHINDSDAFKCPPKVGFQKSNCHTSNSGIDDVFYSDIEENAIQMDLEKSSNNCSISSTKNLVRPRIRPTPHFGQRRNSFVSLSPSSHAFGNEDNSVCNSNLNNDLVQTTQARRERHNSASFGGNSHSALHQHYTPHKYLPTGITNSGTGRIRTESGCSVFSDTNTSSHKSRKGDDHKQSSRKDFETRFQNGVPEKSVIKMSDLIYYNPLTNPIERKPNIKLEQQETVSKDIKETSEKQESCADSFTDSEAVPVPQLKLNAKGELILDDKSLVIETTAEQEARKLLASSSLIYLDEYTGMNGFYSRKKRTREWIPSDTIKFYRCLQNIGTDFSLMVSLFPTRTRRDLKLKFKKEERKNGNLVNKALLYPKQFDIESLKQQIDDEEKSRGEQAKIQKEKIKNLKMEKKNKKKVNFNSKANRVLKNVVYQNEIEQEENRTHNTNIEKDKSDDNLIEQKKSTIRIHNDSVEKDQREEVVHKESAWKLKENTTKETNELFETRTITNNNSIQNNSKKHKKNKYRRRRKWRYYNNAQKKELATVKEEIIKIENKQESNQTSLPNEFQDSKQIEMEIDDLLDSDAVDIQYGNDMCGTSKSNVFHDTSQVCEQIDASFSSNSSGKYIQESNNNNDTEKYEYEHKTFVNLDDGSLNVISNIKDDIVFITSPTTSLLTQPNQSPTLCSLSSSLICPIENENYKLQTITSEPEIISIDTCSSVVSAPHAVNNKSWSSVVSEPEVINKESCSSVISEPEFINNETCSSVVSERELNEDDIQSILTELAEGSLVLVSTLDPDDPDNVLNEIYMVDKNTGDLCEEPLKIPDNIVQCILTVVS